MVGRTGRVQLKALAKWLDYSGRRPCPLGSLMAEALTFVLQIDLACSHLHLTAHFEFLRPTLESNVGRVAEPVADFGPRASQGHEIVEAIPRSFDRTGKSA